MSERGYIHSLQSLGTVDGPGVRAVVFAQGCPLRCVYCHNPDTWKTADGTEVRVDALAERIGRLYPYIKDGGVTLSGGEPCLQARFFSALTAKLHEMGLHVALDTAGCVWNSDVSALLDGVDLVLLDLKFTGEKAYKSHTGSGLAPVLHFLHEAAERNKPVWIRHVVVPGINDTEEDILALRELIEPYRRVIERVELLPFRKLCLEKYEALGINFPLRDTPEMREDDLARLEVHLR